MTGTEFEDAQRDELENYYREFYKAYHSIIDVHYPQKLNDNGEKQPFKLEGIIASIKNKLSNKNARMWSTNQIYEMKDWGNEQKRNIVLLMANIFALWSLLNA